MISDTYGDRHMPVTATAGQASLGYGPPSVIARLTRVDDVAAGNIDLAS